ncbi:LysM peptidoglycan-binding domain-containing protein [Amycolatopsis sp. NPDC088138]|uniref:LysM peptidoglycan-binding domain-containing protein n=1 Tax=Amycolatopsis sp. NPDC088138 TaxID=3363938 RepID=UPI00381AE7B1
MVEKRVPAVRRVLGRTGQAACAGVLFAVLAGGPALAQSAPPPSPSVKYFIVPHAANPDDITLFKIAEKALGDGQRFQEIFTLNKGRPRPDGTPFDDPAAIEPGQVLLLPDDARDPAVKFGPLPTPAPAAPPTQAAAPPSAESGLGTGLASAVSGTGGLLTGLIAGLWWRRRPQVVPPAPFEPAEPGESHEPLWPEPDFDDDDGSGSVSGTLPIPVVVPLPRPDQSSDRLPVVLRQEPITAEHSIIFFDTADTQVIAAIRPGSQFRFRVGPAREPDPVTVLVVDDESE